MDAPELAGWDGAGQVRFTYVDDAVEEAAVHDDRAAVAAIVLEENPSAILRVGREGHRRRL
jgi:hypothetical protein